MDQASNRGSIGKHDWCVEDKGEEGFSVYVDDRQLSYRNDAEKARNYALEIIDRLVVDGDYRLNDKPAGWLPPPLPGRDPEREMLKSQIQATYNALERLWERAGKPASACEQVLWDLQRLIDGSSTGRQEQEIVSEAVEMFDLWVESYGPATDEDLVAIQVAKDALGAETQADIPRG